MNFKDKNGNKYFVVIKNDTRNYIPWGVYNNKIVYPASNKIVTNPDGYNHDINYQTWSANSFAAYELLSEYYDFKGITWSNGVSYSPEISSTITPYWSKGYYNAFEGTTATSSYLGIMWNIGDISNKLNVKETNMTVYVNGLFTMDKYWFNTVKSATNKTFNPNYSDYVKKFCFDSAHPSTPGSSYPMIWYNPVTAKFSGNATPPAVSFNIAIKGSNTITTKSTSSTPGISIIYNKSCNDYIYTPFNNIKVAYTKGEYTNYGQWIKYLNESTASNDVLFGFQTYCPLSNLTSAFTKSSISAMSTPEIGLLLNYNNWTWSGKLYCTGYKNTITTSSSTIKTESATWSVNVSSISGIGKPTNVSSSWKLIDYHFGINW